MEREEEEEKWFSIKEIKGKLGFRSAKKGGVGRRIDAEKNGKEVNNNDGKWEVGKGVYRKF